MDFALSEEQRLLKKVAQEWVAERCPKDLVREMETDEKGYVPGLWKEMADNGWLGLTIPEKYGGAGMSFLELAIVLEEMGRGCLPGPYFSTAVLAAPLIVEAGSEAQKQELLPKIAEGELIATLALNEIDGAWDEPSIKLNASLVEGGFVLNGFKLFVPDANVADVLITAARTDQGVTLFVVDTKAAGLTVTPLKTIAGDKLCAVAFDGVSVSRSQLLGEPGKGWSALDKVLEEAGVAKCAESVGGAQAVLDMTIAYAKERIQFGRAIGSFQVIQHYCATMASEVEGCRFVTYQAACRIAEGLPARKEAAIAKAWTSEAYHRITAVGMQIHGGIGFTMECDMQLYFRRAKTAEVMLGDATFHREKVAQEMGL